MKRFSWSIHEYLNQITSLIEKIVGYETIHRQMGAYKDTARSKGGKRMERIVSNFGKVISCVTKNLMYLIIINLDFDISECTRF